MPSRTFPGRHTVYSWKRYFGKLFAVGGMTSLEHVSACSSNNRYFLTFLLKRMNPLNCKAFFFWLKGVCRIGARIELLRAVEAEGSDQWSFSLTSWLFFKYKFNEYFLQRWTNISVLACLPSGPRTGHVSVQNQSGWQTKRKAICYEGGREVRVESCESLWQQCGQQSSPETRSS